MLDCEHLRETIAERFMGHLSSVDEGGGCTVTLPWIDDLGEALRITVTPHGSDYRVDDDGAIFFALGRLPGTQVARRDAERFARNFLRAHGLTWSSEAQIAELDIDGERLQSRVLHFAQIIGACLTSLPVVANQLDQSEARTRSLGPRLATNLQQGISHWAARYSQPRRDAILRRLRRGHMIGGAANPNWRADFFYEPVLPAPADVPRNAVVVIAVDLRVKQPLAKAEHAITMSRDIGLTRKYTVRMPFVADPDKTDTRVARQLIEVFAEDTYQPFNLDESATQTRFDELVRSELVGEPLF